MCRGLSRTVKTSGRSLSITSAAHEIRLSLHEFAIAVMYRAATIFPGFNFSASADTAFDASGRSLVIDPLLENMLNADLGGGTYLATQPGDTAARTELESLIDRMTLCATGGSPTCATAQRTLEVVKATCAAVLGSATMLFQQRLLYSRAITMAKTTSAALPH